MADPIRSEAIRLLQRLLVKETADAEESRNISLAAAGQPVSDSYPEVTYIGEQAQPRVQMAELRVRVCAEAARLLEELSGQS